MVQSLPELIHHQEQVVTMLETAVTNAEPGNLPSFLQLISVLGRDLGDDLYPHFHRLFGLLVKQVDRAAYSSVGGSPNPELTGKAFETMSYLIKYQLRRLTEEANSMRKYYGPLLGHSALFVRDFSAKTFSVLMRKLKPGSKMFRAQHKYIVKAVASNVDACSPDAHGSISAMMFPELEKGAVVLRGGGDGGEGGDASGAGAQGAVPPVALSKRIDNLLDGLAALHFNTIRGVRGCLHSQGGAKLTAVLDTVLPAALRASNDQCDAGDSADVTLADTWVTFTTAQVMGRCLVKLFRHQMPSNFAELWVRLLAFAEKVVAAARRVNTAAAAAALECTMLFTVEALLFGLSHTNGRGLGDTAVKKSVEQKLVALCLDLCQTVLTPPQAPAAVVAPPSAVTKKQKKQGARPAAAGGEAQTLVQAQGPGSEGSEWRSARLVLRARLLVCRVWLAYPRSSLVLRRIHDVIAPAIDASAAGPAALPPAAPLFAAELLAELPADIVQQHLARPLLAAVAAMAKGDAAAAGAGARSSAWMSVLIDIFFKLRDVRESDAVFEPSASATKVGKRARQGLRGRAPREDWGYESEEMGGGSDDEEEEEGEDENECDCDSCYVSHGE